MRLSPPFAIATAIICSGLAGPLWADEPTYAALKQIEWPERTMYTVLKDMLAQVPSIALSRINFGGMYQPNAINVVIADSGKFEEGRGPIGNGGSRISFDQLYLNAAAIQSNVVVLDGDWLSVILLCAHNRQEASTDNSHPQPVTAQETPDEVVHFHQVLDDARRGEILYAFIAKLSSRQKFRDEARQILSDLTAESRKGQTAYRQAIRTYALAFLPTMLHELAHLDGSINVFDTNGATPRVDAQHPDNSWAQVNLTRREEDRADGVAIKTLTPLIERWKAETQQDISQGSTEGLRYLYSLEAFALIERDIVLINAFSGFRGYRFQDVYYSIYHQACDTSAPRPIGVDFYDYSKVVMAFNGPIPMLTSAEYAHLVATLAPPLSQTHAHAFHRAAALLRLVRLGGQDAAMEQIDQFESLLGHLNSDSSSLPFHLEYQAAKMQYRVTDFFGMLNKLEAQYGHRYNVEQAVLCPFQTCYVVRQSAVKGESEREYFEVSANDGDIVQIKYLSPILHDGSTGTVPDSIKRGWGSQPELTSYSDVYLYHLENMILAGQLLLPTEATLEDFVASMGMLRLSRLRCGYGMTHREFKDRVVLGRTTYTGDAVEFLVVGDRTLMTRPGLR